MPKGPELPASSLWAQMRHPAAIYRVWHEGYFTLLTYLEQIDELREMHGCHCDGNKTKNTSA